jgi:predicted RNase H-like nuclease (RuvC/YqgF family)
MAVALLRSEALGQGSAQQDKAIQSVVEELVGEIRLLRESITQSNNRQSLILVEVERYRMQRDVVSGLSSRVEDTRTEINNVGESISQLGQQFEALNALVQSTTEPERRAVLENNAKEMQANIEQQKQRDSKLREQERRLAEKLQIEQTKLDALDQKLDALVELLSKQSK